MDDLISRQAAIEVPERFIKDCNPEHFVGHQKFIEYMDDAEIGSFGNWQFANGFNMGLTAAEVAIEKLPSAQPEYCLDEWCTECKEYDHERHCCPRFNHVIRTTLQEVKEEQVERKKGKWIIVTDSRGRHAECPYCGEWKYHSNQKFCGECGAQMEGEDE